MTGAHIERGDLDRERPTLREDDVKTWGEGMPEATSSQDGRLEKILPHGPQEET